MSEFAGKVGFVTGAGSVIVNMASILGQVGFAGAPAYAVAKHGIEENAEALNGLVALYPIGRLGRSGDVADLAIWLSSNRASFVTGANYPIDGEYLAR